MQLPLPSLPGSRPRRIRRLGSRPLRRLVPVFVATLLVGACAADNAPKEDVETPKRELVALDPPTWQAGDRWQFNDGYGLRVESVRGDRTILRRTDDPSQWQERRGLFREAFESASVIRRVIFRSSDPARLYDLAVGESIAFIREYMKGSQLVRHWTSWEIEGTETITVPAGQFDTIILTMRTRSLASDWTGYERWWYSPVAKMYVRMEYRYGNAPASVRILTDYKVGNATVEPVGS